MINFFTVTLKSNLDTLKKSIPALNSFYNFSHFTIVCPSADNGLFSKHFQCYPKVSVVSEDNLISKKDFEEIATQIFQASNINPNRIGWYYQQALKLSYALMQQQVGSVVMWDADTIPLRRVEFFVGNRSCLYGSLLEYHTDYFKTIREIFVFDPPKLAYTVQFFSLTDIERQALLKRLIAYVREAPYQSTTNIPKLVSRAILTSIKSVHQKLDRSFISEQELVGLSNSIIAPPLSPVAIVHFRASYKWDLTKSRLKLLSFLGYSHATSEDHKQSNLTKYNILFYFFVLKDFLFQRYKLLKLHAIKSTYAPKISP
jgi:hypothetical protein